MLRNLFLIGFLFVVCAGCGVSKYAPVSGVVKINGQPYGKAVVSFQPMSTEGNPNPGRGSSSYTDADGRYELVSDDNVKGAVVGKHRVRIMTEGGNVVGQDPTKADEVAPDGAPARKEVDPIPPEWYSGEGKEFEVPPGGTDKADFDIITTAK